MSMKSTVVMNPTMRVVPDQDQTHLIHLGASRVTHNVLTAQSYQLNAPPVQTSFVLNPPSLQTIVDRFLRVRAYMEVEVDQDLVLGVEDSLRQFPLSSIIDVTSLSINGETISDNTERKLHAMLCYGNTPEERVKSWSTSPCMPDQYQEYKDWATYGSARNTAAFYGENSAEMSRGGFEIEVIDPRRFRVVVTEPIWISPLYQGLHHQVEGMVNVNELVVNLRHSANVGRVLSHSSSGNAITVVNTTFYRAPEILSTFYTPDLTQSLPQLQILPYSRCNEFIRTMSQMAPGAEQQVFSDTIRLSQIPRFIYLFARRNQQSSTFGTCDSFLSIENVNLTWGNQAGLLASATKQDLFEMSRRAGCNLSYPQWSKYRGSVLCIEMGKDIGLQDYESPGVNGGYVIQANVTFKNQSDSPMDCDFYIVTCNQGTFSIAPNTARSSLGDLTPEMVMAARSGNELPHLDYADLQGSGFWSSLKNIVHKISTVAAPVLSGIAGPEIGAIASAVRDATGSGRVSGGTLTRRR